jgi:putative toxin-antitoxin system antitoxin component (TIGR02293 family)
MATAPAPPKSPTLEEALGKVQLAQILGVHPRTIERRKTGAKRLPRLQAERQQKVERIWRQLLEIFEPPQAVSWLRSPVPVIDYRRPLDVMAEEGGLDRILDVVGRMSWGVCS